MSFDEISNLYYTAAQARGVLGLNEDAFQYWVKTGRIARTMLPGGKRGVYSKREIDRIALQIKAKLELNAPRDLELKAATSIDVDAEIHLAHLIYGDRVLLPEAQKARHQLVEANSETTWCLYDREILGATINIVPVTVEAIEQFKKGVRGWLFVPDHVQQYEPSRPQDCIVIDYMTTPTVPPVRRSFYGETLLRMLAHTTFREWGMRGIELRKIYTCGSTSSGRALLRKSGIFRELGEPVPDRVIFELDVATTNSALLRGYKDALATR